jgi:membrane protein
VLIAAGTIAWVTGTVDRLRRRIEQTLLVRCLRRYVRINGTTLALVIAAQAFTALIPLLIVVASLIPAGDRGDLGQTIVERFHVSGDAETAVRTLFSRPPGAAGAFTIVGFILLVVSGLSVSRALERTYEAAWGLPRAGVRGSLNGVVALTVLLTNIVLLALLAGLLRGVPAGSIVTFLFRAGLSVLVWLVLQHLLLSGRVGWRPLLPGAIIAAVGQQAVSLSSAVWMPRLIEQNASRYGVIGVTFALLTWLLVIGVMLVAGAVVSAEMGGQRRPAGDD